MARATVANTEDIALESLEEHHIVKWLLSELVDLEPASERFDAKVTVVSRTYAITSSDGRPGSRRPHSEFQQAVGVADWVNKAGCVEDVGVRQGLAIRAVSSAVLRGQA